MDEELTYGTYTNNATGKHNNNYEDVYGGLEGWLDDLAETFDDTYDM